ncbi:hypothetical protein G6N05_15275 [Flavobacterium sp. F372]|uniref:HEAT repeat domain-containing protein n=1 Tax=Flavobacterium bernardetii TaxID=2813823 RepID=A0ABR7J3E2_9FLAO|nr:hypothetical protein [Flavobacterium bernardetii]MBC5836252.1 hypothetical protein [Flavobacterium bernardetii]NHF71474.1 hypothetical protein [Flavobacterium bernardetii]
MTENDEIRNQFLNSLKLGTGKTYLILKQNPSIDFSDLIVKGAVENFAYDAQSEGSRANYIFKLIQKSKKKEKITSTILTKLVSKKTDDYGLDQLCDLAVLFHKHGNLKAKDALYKRFEKNIIDGYEICGQSQMMKIDGINGVLKYAEIIGEILSKDVDDYEDSWRIDYFQKENKQIDVYKEIEKASKENIFIGIFYKSILEHNWKIPRRKKIKRFTYEIVKEKIDSEKFFFISREKANELSVNEVEKLANEFLIEKNITRKEHYLSFFSKRKFPFDYQPILNIANSKSPKNSRLNEYAFECLQYFSAKEIRDIAIDKLKSEKNTTDYLNLLVGNYEIGDYKILNNIADKSDDYDYIHSIVFGFLDIYKANKVKECKEPLEKIYHKMNCGLHRDDILEVLYENDVLCKEILTEMEFDSDEKVRKMFRKIRKKVR